MAVTLHHRRLRRGGQLAPAAHRPPAAPARIVGAMREREGPLPSANKTRSAKRGGIVHDSAHRHRHLPVHRHRGLDATVRAPSGGDEGGARRAITSSCARASANTAARCSRSSVTGLCAAFADARDAMEAALSAQRALAAERLGRDGRTAGAHGTSYRRRGNTQRRIPVVADVGADAARDRGRARRPGPALGKHCGCRAQRAAGNAPRCAIWARTSCAASPKRKRSTSSWQRTCLRNSRRCVPNRPREWSRRRCSSSCAASSWARSAETRQLAAHWDLAQAGARAAGAHLRRAGRGQDAPRAQSLVAHAQRERRRALARRLLRVRGHDARTCRSSRRCAIGRGSRAPAQLRTALGDRGARDRQVRARDRGEARGRSRPVRRCRRTRSGCGCSTTPRASSRSLAAERRRCSFSSTTCTGPTRARCRCSTTCCAACATTACSCLAAYRESGARPRASARGGARGVEPRAPGDARRSSAACRATDTGALLATLFGQERVSEEFATALYRETEGNPFFVEEVVKSLIEQGQIYREGDGWGRKETQRARDCRRASRRRSGVGSTACEASTVDAAAHRGGARQDASAFGELAAVVSAADEDALLDALDEASAAQLIRADVGGTKAAGADDGFAFTHDKIREVLNEEAESDPPPPAAPAHRRSAGEAVRHGARARRSAPTSTRRISRTTSCRR